MSVITELGRVVAVDDECLWVETIQRSTCESCAAEKGCGQSLVAKWGGRTSFIRVLLEGRDPASFCLHDEVQLGIPEDVVAKGSLLVYLAPLSFMLLALALADVLRWPELAVIGFSFFGLLVGAAGVRWHSYSHRNDRRMQPVLLDGLEPVSWIRNASTSNFAESEMTRN